MLIEVCLEWEGGCVIWECYGSGGVVDRRTVGLVVLEDESIQTCTRSLLFDRASVVP